MVLWERMELPVFLLGFGKEKGYAFVREIVVVTATGSALLPQRREA